MPSPFPGMDPYIETPKIWSDFHNNLATEAQGQLNLPVNKKLGHEAHTDYRRKRRDLSPPPDLSAEARWLGEHLRECGRR